MSSQTTYSAGRMFCPFCGTILPIPASSEVVTCQLCRFQQKTEVYEGVEEYSCRYFAVRKEKHKLSEKQQGPLVEHKCPKCGNDEMTYTTQQTRSADEGQTIFYICPKCKYKETENS